MITGEKRVKEIICLLSAAVIVAFFTNYFSPAGIALKGDWDTEKGVVSARSKSDVVEHGIEIQSAVEARRLFDAGDTLFVDARNTQSYDEGRIKGAVLLSVHNYEDRIDSFAAKYAPDQKIVTYCSGRECDDSHKLAQMLYAEGYIDVRVFIDGYPAWLAEGFPVE